MSQYSSLSKSELIVEAEYLQNCLYNILRYIQSGGDDLDRIVGEVMDGLYESRY